MLTLTSEPDPNDIDHVGIAVTVTYIENQMGEAAGDADVSLDGLSHLT